MADEVFIESNFSIDGKLNIVRGDEHFFRIMGDKALDSFDQLIYEGDFDNFKNFIAKDGNSYNVILRLKCKNDNYRWFIIYNQGSYISQSGVTIYNLQMQDILVISNRFEMYLRRVTKYRSILNVIEEKIFEYDNSSRMITIYCYRNDKSEIIEKDYIDDWMHKVIGNGYVDDTQRDYFEVLCNNIKYGSEKFQITLRTSLMSRGEREDLLTFAGETITSGNERVVTVGIIKEHSARMQILTNVMYDVSEFDKDAATGLLNKKAVTKEFKNMINSYSAGNSDKKLYIAILDIDNFKSANDTYGHLFGDKVITSFAEAIKEYTQGRGIAGRIGGDEFAVLLNDINNENEVKTLLSSLLIRVKNELEDKRNGYDFSASVGVSTYPIDGRDYETLFRTADCALYIAKERGKDMCIVYDNEVFGDITSMTMKQLNAEYGRPKLSPVDRTILLCDTIDALRCIRTREELDMIIKYFLNKTGIDGISIFKGMQMKCVWTFGSYEYEPDPAEYVRKRFYSRYFDKNNANRVNNVMTLVVDNPDVYSSLKKNNICSMLQFKSFDDETEEVLVQYDIFGNVIRKWSDEDVALLYGITKVFINVYDRVNEENN